MKKLILSFAIALTMSLGMGAAFAPAAYAANPTDSAKAQVCEGVSGQTGGTCAGGGADLSNIAEALLNILSIVAGLVAVVMIIVSGIKYITSGGDAQAVAGAKKSLIYSIVGLVVVALSYFIVAFVLGELS